MLLIQCCSWCFFHDLNRHYEKVLNQWFLSWVAVCEHVCACSCNVHMHFHVCVIQRTALRVLSLGAIHLVFWRHISQRTWSTQVWLGWMAWESQGSCCCLSNSGMKNATTPRLFYVGAGDRTSVLVFFFNLFLFCEHKSFICIYVYKPSICLELTEVGRGLGSPWNWSYRWQ